METVELTYLVQPPKKWTFEQTRLKKWVEGWCEGKVLNLFAGKVLLAVDEFRVDISPEFNPDCCCDVLDFLCRTDCKFDTVILDPPYSYRKSKEKYGGKYVGNFDKVKDKVVNVLNPKGRVITLGYNSVGMGKRRGFRKLAVCLVCNNGDHSDTMSVVEILD